MTEYIFSKNGEEIKKIKCSKEFAASIAVQTGCDFRVAQKPQRQPQKHERKSRETTLINEIRREMPAKDKR